ncbi:MAG TPA: tripartite tricarboxylate transporter substrate binding protein [Burkholderiaceae bacterium]|nr:tripartite tricarboxylate transporter substrate binding protein [Burkholderiaceae bacterium]
MKKTLYGLVAASMLAISPASHAAWPGERPIQMIVAYAPGGGTDIMARLVARFAEERLPGSRFVVVNKPGAGGAIGFEEIARSKPDGYTIGMINAPGFNFMPLYRNTNYKPEDFDILARVVADPILIYAKKDSTVPKDLKAIIAQLKEKPESLSFGHSGDGTVGHIGLLRMQEKEGFKANFIPFKGGADTRVSLAGGHIDYGLLTSGELPEAADPASAFVAVAQLSEQRQERFSQVPTAGELGVEIVTASERGFAAPKGIPEEIRQRLETVLREILQDPKFIEAAKADAPVLSYKAGGDWAKQLQEESEALKPLAEVMKK